MTILYRMTSVVLFVICGISLSFDVPAKNLYFFMFASIYFLLASIYEEVSR